MAYQIRVNTRSTRVAATTRAILEKSLEYKFCFAMSTRNLIFLDFDCRDEFDNCYREVIIVGRTMVDRYGGEALVYRTPNGFHLMHTVWMDWKKIERTVRSFIVLINEGVLKYLDRAHLEASLRRGYLTLRLNQIRLVARIVRVGEEVRVYEL